MSESLLVADIEDFLRLHARGRASAVPRHKLRRYLHTLGHTVSDRTLRRVYGGMPNVGHSCADPKGLYWIVTAEDRRVTEGNLHAKSMSELAHEKRVRDAAPCGQRELFEEGR